MNAEYIFALPKDKASKYYNTYKTINPQTYNLKLRLK